VDFYIGLKSVPCRAVPDSKALKSLRHQPGESYVSTPVFDIYPHSGISIPGGRHYWPIVMPAPRSTLSKSMISKVRAQIGTSNVEN